MDTLFQEIANWIDELINSFIYVGTEYGAFNNFLIFYEPGKNGFTILDIVFTALMLVGLILIIIMLINIIKIAISALTGGFFENGKVK